MNKFTCLALGLWLTISLVGCKKDGAEPDAPKLSPKEAKMASKKYHITAMSITQTFMGQTVKMDAYSTLRTCIKDNFWVMNEDKTGYVDEGPTRCATTDPQKINFTWSLNADETELTTVGTVKSTTEEQKVKLVEVTDTKFRTSITKTTVSNGIEITSVMETTYTAF